MTKTLEAVERERERESNSNELGFVCCALKTIYVNTVVLVYIKEIELNNININKRMDYVPVIKAGM